MEEAPAVESPEPVTVEHPAPEPLAVVEEPAPRGRWRFITLVPNDGQEPPFDVTAHRALAVWVAVSAPWHPALLAEAAELPRSENLDYPASPGPDEVRIFPTGMRAQLPSGYETQAADIGAILIEGTADRDELVRRISERIALPIGEGGPEAAGPVVLDYLALGTTRWWLRDLTIGMGHVDVLDIESLTREALAGARAWKAGDQPGATNRLRAAFEVMTQARERFYPVDAYVVDLCLIDPSAPAGTLADPLAARSPVTFVAPARAIEAQANRDPGQLAELVKAIEEGWVDVVGGPYGEADEPLRPLESILWQYRKGYETYRRHLDDRAVETFARRRFGLYAQLPQIARRFGFRFALHLGLDDGRFPAPVEAKRLWESPDGSHLESLMRIPHAADRPSEGLHLPWRLARAMKNDHVATVPLVHWPGQVAGWFQDFRRVVAYSPVMARWVTLNDYFHLTDRPFETFRPEPDQYVFPYLSQAVARLEPAPISRRASQAKLRARIDGLSALRALTRVLGRSGPPATEESNPLPLPAEAEDAAESGRFAEAETALERLEPAWASALSAAVLGEPVGEGRPGFLVFNPLAIPRRAAVQLPGADLDLRPEGPLRVAQFTDEGVWGVVDLPAFGYAWVPRASAPNAEPTPVNALGVRDRTLRNELMELEIDTATGGIRGLRAAGEPVVRLGQQLVFHGLNDAEGKPATSRMRAERFEVDFGGPALVQAVSTGTLRDPADDRMLARFEQRFRLWSGRPILEIDVTLTDLDPSWVARVAGADPWAAYLACRWAWPDAESDLTRTCLLAAEPTTSERPETPDAIEVLTRKQRTTLLFGGLAHHRRHGARMLDTILIAGRETGRRFRLGVAIEQDLPFRAAQDFLVSAHVVPVDHGPPATGPAGWFFQIDNRGVAVTRVEPIDHSGDGRGWGVVFHLLECAGRAARARLRLPHNPVWARQTDFNGELIVDLPIDGDTILIDLTPGELARVDVTMG